MAGSSLSKVYGALKRGSIAGVYYLTGVEDVLKDELVAALMEAVLEPSSRDFNLDVRSAADLDGETLHALVETPPMLAERRMVVVRGIDQWRKNAKVWDVLYRYLDQPSPSTVLVLTQGGEQGADARVARGALHVPVDGLEPAHVNRWLAHRAARAGVTLEPDAAEHLVAAVGGDLGHLAVEIDKLAAATAADHITAADVAAFVGVRRGETVSDWVDSVLGREPRRAIDLLGVVLQQAGVTGVQLVMTLGTALVGVRLARALADGGTAWNHLRDAVFQRLRAARPPRLRNWGIEAETWVRAAHAWSAEDLDAALKAATTADQQLKSTTISDERGILVSMVLSVPLPKAAA
jgi:DNA polymerase-3 subunit delta